MPDPRHDRTMPPVPDTTSRPAGIPAHRELSAADRRRRSAVTQRFGALDPVCLEALADGRGRVFQRLELMGDSVLEVVLHAHSVLAGPSCRVCAGRADLFTTNAHLQQLARRAELGGWLDWHPSSSRLGDLVEACTGALFVNGRWPRVIGFVDAELHPIPPDERRRILHGGAQVHPDAPARCREILGAAILEAAASTSAYLRHPELDEGQLSRIKARMLSGEHILGRCRDSRWVRRRLRTRHFVRDDVERLLAEDLLAHGLASAVSIAWPLVT